MKWMFQVMKFRWWIQILIRLIFFNARKHKSNELICMKLNGTYLDDVNVFYDTPVRWMWCIAWQMKWNLTNLDRQLTPRCGSFDYWHNQETLVFEPWSEEAAWPSESTDQANKHHKRITLSDNFSCGKHRFVN